LLVDGSKGWLSYAPGAALGGLIIDGTVPKVNVLILEDNIINQNLLEAFMKRPNVR
jgi:osomolarity two-component system response regulator SSK1